MKHSDPPSDRHVVAATMNGDKLDLVLTAEGYATFLAFREHLRETNPSADFDEVIHAMLEALVDQLENQN